MKMQLFVDQLADSRVKTSVLAGLSLLLALALLANGLFRSGTVVVMVPPEIDREMWAAGNEASPEYFTKVAMSMIPYIANLHPQSVELSHKTFMGYVHPAVAGTIQEQLSADKAYVIDRQMSRTFYPTSVTVNKDVVTLIGIERRYIGGTLVKDGDPRFYRIKLKMENWKPFVVSVTAGAPDVEGGMSPHSS